MAPQYSPQVDEPTSFEVGPPPAYPKGYSVRLKLIKLAAQTGVLMVLILGSFVLLSVYLRSTSSCSCGEENTRRFDAEPLIAEPSHQVKLKIGENLRDHKGRSHLDCMVERSVQSLDAAPPKGNQILQVKGEETIISCISNKNKRTRRSPICDCNCAC